MDSSLLPRSGLGTVSCTGTGLSRASQPIGSAVVEIQDGFVPRDSPTLGSCSPNAPPSGLSVAVA